MIIKTDINAEETNFNELEIGDCFCRSEEFWSGYVYMKVDTSPLIADLNAVSLNYGEFIHIKDTDTIIKFPFAKLLPLGTKKVNETENSSKN